MEASKANLVSIVEALLLVYQQPLSFEQLHALFEEHERPTKTELEEALERLRLSCENRSFELKCVASGYRLQIRSQFAPWTNRLWEEKPQRYSRALLETLALIAYRQPITRGEIEDIRGVTVSSQIIKTLQEREWIRVVGYKDVPGKPAMLATTKAFLDYFNLKSLEELPTLASMIQIQPELSILEEESLLTQKIAEIDTAVTPDQPQQERDFKQLLAEWDALEQDVKTDFNDLIDTLNTNETKH